MSRLATALALLAAVACTKDPAPPPPPPDLGGSLLSVTAREGRLAAPDGTVRTIGEHVLDPATGRTATWSSPRAVGDHLAGTATGFVTNYHPVGRPPELVVVDPARLLAGGKPAIVPLSLRAVIVECAAWAP